MKSIPPDSYRSPLIWTAVIALGCGCNGDFDFRLPDPAVRVVAFGDSATAGPAEMDYIEFLPSLLSQPAGAFTNEGRGGETTDRGVDRLRSLITRGLFPNADTVLFWEGGNDLTDWIEERDGLLIFSPSSPGYPFAEQLTELLDDVQANIESAIDIARQAGLQVYVATYFSLPAVSLDCDPLFLNILLPSQAANANAYVAMLNERIRSAAVNRGAVVADVAAADDTLMADPRNYFNCNHLSARGNEIVANVFSDTIRAGS